ncbi:inorganic diphosphatase [Maribacter algarum]|uniref:inorganic diphosphatase n=1 Tax=Maribacter algarum (ex Zhang et al. 2020) TaxID=2578118 RepID=A0A5S3PVG9_9FLAO|nr:inorganic diphosphatase [Maribacter algarum]TMM58940.1 inorganic diphosphatase [Maribacter algarum]
MKGTAILLFFLVCSCNQKRDYYETPSFSAKGAVNAVIEIPAGTNSKYEYDHDSKEFIIDQENGKDRVIDFLSYPGNYGFIPSTISDKKTGGDGDALDILVLSESHETGTIVEVLPIAMLKLVDKGEQDYKIIAVPMEKEKRIVKASTYAELQKNYPMVIEIIELWFLNYNKNDVAVVEGWGDGKEAIKEIRQAVKK